MRKWAAALAGFIAGVIVTVAVTDSVAKAPNLVGRVARIESDRTVPDAVNYAQRAACSVQAQMLSGRRHTKAQSLVVVDPSAITPSPRDIEVRRHCGNKDRSPYRVKVTVRLTRDGDVVITDGLSLHRALQTVRAQDGTFRARLTLRPKVKSVSELITMYAERYGIDVQEALDVAWCESKHDPGASNACCHGVYSQHEDFWDGRAAHYGYPGASPYDPIANIDVSLQMRRDVGSWHPHWSQCAP